MLGRTLGGQYTIKDTLGSGSMGMVYRAYALTLGRDVAIKVLRSERALDEASKARFLREARAHRALTSAHTVAAFDFGQSPEGEMYLVMELLDGETLGDRLKREGRLSPQHAIDTAVQALSSLAEAHAKGIVHRDLKPDNLVFARQPDGTEIVKIVDFGIAKMLGQQAEALNAIETQEGTVFGTPRYMSPEQAQAKALDCRSDLYSLGVIVYQMLAGVPPFADEDAIVVMARHIKTPPTPLLELEPPVPIGPALERVVMQSLAKNPDQRPQTAETMAELLRGAIGIEAGHAAVSGARPVSSHRLNAPDLSPFARWALAIGVVLVVAAGLGLGIRWRHTRPTARAHAAPTSAAAANDAEPNAEPSPPVEGSVKAAMQETVDVSELPAAHAPSRHPATRHRKRSKSRR